MNFLKDFYHNYISLNLSDYSGFGIDLEINKVVFFASVVLCIASFVISSYERNLSLVLRKLYRSGSFSKDEAKTLSELGLSDNKAVKSILIKRSGISKRLISFIDTSAKENVVTEESEEQSGEDTRNGIITSIETAKFYINGEEKPAAENYYKSKNSSIAKTALYCVIILAFYFVIALLMPSILTVLSNLLSN